MWVKNANNILKQQQLQQETCSQSFQICQFDKKTCGKTTTTRVSKSTATKTVTQTNCVCIVLIVYYSVAMIYLTPNTSTLPVCLWWVFVIHWYWQNFAVQQKIILSTSTVCNYVWLVGYCNWKHYCLTLKLMIY